MKILPLLFLLAILASSCATMINESTTEVTVITDKPAKIKVDSYRLPQSISTTETDIFLFRSQDSLKIEVISDSSTKTVFVAPQFSSTFYVNLISYGIGMLFEFNEDKAHTYPSPIWINIDELSDSSDANGGNNKYYTYNPKDRTGEFYLHVSLPHWNIYHFNPDLVEETKISNGFFGFSVGLDYYHSISQYFALNFAGATSLPVPFPAPIDYEGDREWYSSTSMTLTNNHVFNRFTFGYGLSFANNRWSYIYDRMFYKEDNPEMTEFPENLYSSTFAIGLAFPLYYKWTDSFFVGMIYRPTFYRFSDKNTFDYEHLISLDFGWKIGM